MQSKNIVVLMGGRSAEREVSLVSGQAICDALEHSGHHVTQVDPAIELIDWVGQIKQAQPDIIFNALHGRYGEDGCIQGVLEHLGIPYTHSGVAASAIAMDKYLTKHILDKVGVPAPDGMLISKEDFFAGRGMNAPFALKPSNEGSSVGIHLVRENDNGSLQEEDWVYGSQALMERYIPGRELTVGVIGKLGDAAKALDVTEIIFNASLFDYTAKYTEGHATHVLPAQIPDMVAAEAKRLAVLAHETLGCNGISRSDFRWDETKDGISGLYFLEINTQPGFTPLSLLPEQAKHCNIGFAQLCDFLIETALCPEPQNKQ